MSRKTPNTVLYIGIAVSVGIFIGSMLDYRTEGFSLFSKNTQENKIKRLINYIQYDYVDTVDSDSLLDDAINVMLEKLDPHSVYIPKSELQGIRESMDGNFMGIGIQFRMIRDSVTVLNIIKGGPSEKAGLLAGDRLLMADKDTLFGKGYSSNQIMNRLKTKEPEEVTLLVYRKQKDTLLEFRFDRGPVNLVSVPVYYMINDKMGFLKIDRFARNTYKEFRAAMDDLIQQGMQTLILDLRGNTGGFLDIANRVADEFLEDGKPIVSTKTKSDKVIKKTATTEGNFEHGILYVLIDEESASASEVIAGALQDNDKGTIVGRRSFGKGLVQQEMELGDGSAIRLTTARYYTPTGRSIQKPYRKNNEAYFNNQLQRYHNGELLYKDSIPINDSLKYTTPKGKIVYGGGGIIPDVFVPIDSSFYFLVNELDNISKLSVQQNNRAVEEEDENVHSSAFSVTDINDFIFDYIDKDREKYTSMTWESFKNSFDEKALVTTYLENKNIKNHQSITTQFLGTYLKTLMARELFGELGFYKMNKDRDKMIEKVLELEK